MEFEHTLPEWKNEGKEPTDALKTSGFQKGDRPAATIFNWFWATTAKAITELQTKMASQTSGGGMVGTEEEMNDNYVADPASYSTIVQEGATLSVTGTTATVSDPTYSQFTAYAILGHSGATEDFTLTISGMGANLGVLSIYWGGSINDLVESGSTSVPSPADAAFSIVASSSDSLTFTPYVGSTAYISGSDYSIMVFNFAKSGEGVWQVSWTDTSGSTSTCTLNTGSLNPFEGYVYLYAEGPGAGNDSFCDMSVSISSGEWLVEE